MKKLYALAAALVATVAVNAQLYVTGNGNGLGWDPANPLEATQTADGYTFTVDNLIAFKMSSAKGNWDAWNANALWFQPTQANLGQPINLVNGTGDISTPWPGNYTVTVSLDYKTAVITTDTPKPVEKIDVYVRGDMNNWGTPEDWKFQTEDYIHYSLSCSISAGQYFKIADGNWGRVNYGGNGGKYTYGTYPLYLNSQSNMSFSEDFTGVIYFDLEPGASELQVTFAEPPFVEPGVTYSIFGTLTGSDRNIETPMTLLESGQWQLADIYTEGGVFWIRRFADGTLDSTLGCPAGELNFPELNTTLTTSSEANAQSWWLDRGFYTITYNAKAQTVYITGNVLPGEFEYPETLFVLGNIDGTNWSTTEGVAMQREGNVYTASNVTVDDADFGYGYFSFSAGLGENWDEVNNYDRYGAPTSDCPIAVGQDSEVYLFRGYNLVSSGCNAWKIEAGSYDFIVDFNTMMLSVTKAGDSIISVENESNAAPVYYNLQGVRVNNPTTGLFIEVKGNTTRKVILK